MNRLTATVALLGLAVSPLPAEQFGLFTCRVNDDDTVSITDYPQDAVGDVVIPSEIDRMPVTGIDTDAFLGCSCLTSISVPESITYIGERAFYGCGELTSIVIPQGVTSISSEMLAECTALSAVTIPDSVTSIGWAAFLGCTSLASIALPGSIDSIWSDPFQGCKNLHAILVSSRNADYTSEDGVLFNASRTTLIRYPEGKVGHYTIPASVTTIHHDSFFGCGG